VIVGRVRRERWIASVDSRSRRIAARRVLGPVVLVLDEALDELLDALILLLDDALEVLHAPPAVVDGRAAAAAVVAR
jgi:hypothetical protein